MCQASCSLTVLSGWALSTKDLEVQIYPRVRFKQERGTSAKRENMKQFTGFPCLSEDVSGTFILQNYTQRVLDHQSGLLSHRFLNEDECCMSRKGVTLPFWYTMNTSSPHIHIP